VWIFGSSFDVNDGYTLIGNYQDLNHSGVNYTNAERIQLLDQCLMWLDSFDKHMLEYDYASFVFSADPTQLFIRPKTSLSPYFWGQIALIPDLSDTGLENLGVLEEGLALESMLNYTTVMGLTEVYTNKNHSIFHGYRKLSRSILSVATYPVYDTLNCTNDAFNNVTAMYNNFGNLNDEVTAYQFYKEHNQTQQEEQQKQVVIQGWASLQQWMVSTKWLQQLECVILSIILPGEHNVVSIIE